MFYFVWIVTAFVAVAIGIIAVTRLDKKQS